MRKTSEQYQCNTSISLPLFTFVYGVDTARPKLALLNKIACPNAKSVSQSEICGGGSMMTAENKNFDSKIMRMMMMFS